MMNQSAPKKTDNCRIRKAEMTDLVRILDIYAAARKFMAENGNPSQWGNSNPPRSRVVRDIEEKLLYVIIKEDRICGVFYFYIGEDPTYREIYEGRWRAEKPYGTIHRIAGDGSGGIVQAAVRFAGEQIDYLRIDTHQNNTSMRNAVCRAGFHPCGIIYVADGSPRIAYDLFVEK